LEARAGARTNTPTAAEASAAWERAIVDVRANFIARVTGARLPPAGVVPFRGGRDGRRLHGFGRWCRSRSRRAHGLRLGAQPVQCAPLPPLVAANLASAGLMKMDALTLSQKSLVSWRVSRVGELTREHCLTEVPPGSATFSR